MSILDMAIAARDQLIADARARLADPRGQTDEDLDAAAEILLTCSRDYLDTLQAQRWAMTRRNKQ